VPVADRFDQIVKGQVWRVVTPIFLHFGILHFIFNMFWLRDLGGVLETKHGTLWLAMFIGASAVLSNVAQAIVTGPYFGGMSGVVYALFGYCWMSGVLRPYDGIVLRREIVILMLAWLVLCFTGLLGPIANTAHLVGLLAGVGWVAIPHYLKRMRRA
jgi:GlpG protein